MLQISDYLRIFSLACKKWGKQALKEKMKSLSKVTVKTQSQYQLVDWDKIRPSWHFQAKVDPCMNSPSKYFGKDLKGHEL